DSVIAKTMTGYVHNSFTQNYLFRMNDEVSDSLRVDLQKGECNIIGNNKDPDIQRLLIETYWRDHQLRTFLPVTYYSCGFWHLTDPEITSSPALAPMYNTILNSVLYAQRLRLRLQQYAYDKAMDWYTTGKMTAFQPLFMVPEWQN